MNTTTTAGALSVFAGSCKTKSSARHPARNAVTAPAPKAIAAASPKPAELHTAERRAQFEALALPLLDRLFSMALHLVRDPAKADDLVQETVLRAWQNFDRFQIGTHFKAWIFQILTYLFLNDRRSAQRRETQVDFSEHDVLEAAPPNDPSTVVQPRIDWDTMYPSLVDDVMKRALDRLPGEQRVVFLLVTLGELSYKECADTLDIPIGTVMSRLFRARKQLQEELSGYARERGFVRQDGDVELD